MFALRCSRLQPGSCVSCPTLCVAERDLAKVSGLGRKTAEQDERKREGKAVGSGEVHGTCEHSLSPSTGQCAVSLGTGPEWEDTEMARAPSRRRTLMPLPQAS